MKGIRVREAVCIGCGLCRVYCLVEHSHSKDLIKAFKKENPRPLARIRVDRWEEISFPVQCHHCAEPWCTYSCLTGAMQKDPLTGVVSVDPERCIGCGTCIVACPYGALAKDTSKRIIAKCDFCLGLTIPACVANCPNEALVLITNGEETQAESSG